MTCGPGLTPMDFNVHNPRAVEWIERHAATLIEDITRSTREALRTVLAQSVEAGVGPRDTARLLRSAIGLTERDAGALAKVRAALADPDNAGKIIQAGKVRIRVPEDGLSKERLEAITDRYAAKLLNSRATTIARTEMMKASNEGQLELWQQAQDDGLLSDGARKVWITTDPCELCEPLEGESVLVTEPFSNGLMAPPVHPNCRCTVGLV